MPSFNRQIALALFHVNSATFFLCVILFPFLITVACGTIFDLHGRVFDLAMILVFILSIILGYFGAKWRAKVAREFQLERLEKSATLHADKSDNDKAKFEKLPRKLLFNESVGGNPPEVYQMWMLLNPLLWLTLFYFVSACSVDEELKMHGQASTARLISAQQNDNSYSNKGTTFSSFRQKLTFQYFVQDKPYLLHVDDCSDPDKYSIGSSYGLMVLPGKPQVHEPFGKGRGAKQFEDLYTGMLFLIAVLLFEFSIWYQPLRHRRLAKIGRPLPVRIKALTHLSSFMMSGSSSMAPSKFRVETEPLENNAIGDYAFEIDGVEFGRLQTGAIELVLVDPVFEQNVVLYRFCKYQVVD